MRFRYPAGYDTRGLMPDADRLAEAHHVKRDPDTDEITWPPSSMAAILRTLKLINTKKDLDT